MGNRPSSPSSTAVALPEQAKISSADLRAAGGTGEREAAVRALGEAFAGPRAAVLALDDELGRRFRAFRDASAEWLESAPDEEKTKFSPTQDSCCVNPRKKNLGYLDARPVKEFLKLRLEDVDNDDLVPEPVRGPFKELVEMVVPLMETCYRAWANAPVDAAADSDAPAGVAEKLPYMKAEFADLVWSKMAGRSSLTVVHYLPQETEDADDGNNDSNTVCPEDQLTQPGRIYPSKTHTDTGLMTMILCSTVSGLEVCWTRHVIFF
jgi:hypothetical protein